jgi:hypothetical protein
MAVRRYRAEARRVPDPVIKGEGEIRAEIRDRLRDILVRGRKIG